MSEITADLVKALRERTGAAMMDCKRALVEVGGDIEAAVEAMRKSGQAKADKKADRIAAEGIIAIAQNPEGTAAAMIDLNCETDFVARGDDFKEFAQLVARTALSHEQTNIDALNSIIIDQKETLDEIRRNLISKVGENVQIRRIAFLKSPGVVGTYVHGNRIGVLVSLNIPNTELAKDLGMQIAANNPLVVAPEDVSAELIAKEREIYTAQASNSGKPADITAKMVEGQIKKYLQEVSLLGQAFVKNPDLTVAKLLADNKAQVIEFIRFTVGEGIEKKANNFAEEVMAQIQD